MTRLVLGITALVLLIALAGAVAVVWQFLAEGMWR